MENESIFVTGNITYSLYKKYLSVYIVYFAQFICLAVPAEKTSYAGKECFDAGFSWFKMAIC